MSVAIREMGPDDFDVVAAFWREFDQAAPAEGFTEEMLSFYQRKLPGLSLVAQDDGELVAVMICAKDEEQLRIHNLVVDPACDVDAVAAMLMHKALAKLYAKTGRTCRMRLSNIDKGIAFWQQYRWIKNSEPARWREFKPRFHDDDDAPTPGFGGGSAADTNGAASPSSGGAGSSDGGVMSQDDIAAMFGGGGAGGGAGAGAETDAEPEDMPSSVDDAGEAADDATPDAAHGAQGQADDDETATGSEVADQPASSPEPAVSTKAAPQQGGTMNQDDINALFGSDD